MHGRVVRWRSREGRSGPKPADDRARPPSLPTAALSMGSSRWRKNRASSRPERLF
ncbi:hypothetical protein ALSL_2268 [Aerosticca soli]|uniref:Uncharacterized protein n=1 Tax=Aerosticca soli TaxID=2010829 RepID=A0A2Z6E889_9GAMM|nr:hypothetical protein ALSL_2268 [Aerosticca soli]